jgi:hypothetical protein
VTVALAAEGDRDGVAGSVSFENGQHVVGRADFGIVDPHDDFAGDELAIARGCREGPRIISEETRREMKKILAEVKSGEFAKEFINEMASGGSKFKALYEKDYNHPIEEVGRKLRKMMKWIDVKEV